MKITAKKINDVLDGRGGNPWPGGPFQSHDVDVATQVFDDAAAAWSAFVAGEPARGWVQWQSRQQPFLDGAPQPEAAWGTVLAAEGVVVPDRDTVEVRHFDGRWHLTRYRLAEGDGWLSDRAELLLAAPPGRLCYRRFWQPAEHGAGYEQAFACLTELRTEEHP